MPFFDHYPYTNLHNVNLDWVLEAVKNWGAMVEQNNQNFIDLNAANEAFKEYVTSYITNLDVQEEINNKLDQMLASGALTPYFSPYIKTDVEEWLEENITPTTPAIDASLSIAGAAADAKATGDALTTLKSSMLEEVYIPFEINKGITTSNGAWTTEDLTRAACILPKNTNRITSIDGKEFAVYIYNGYMSNYIGCLKSDGTTDRTLHTFTDLDIGDYLYNNPDYFAIIVLRSTTDITIPVDTVKLLLSKKNTIKYPNPTTALHLYVDGVNTNHREITSQYALSYRTSEKSGTRIKINPYGLFYSVTFKGLYSSSDFKVYPSPGITTDNADVVTVPFDSTVYVTFMTHAWISRSKVISDISSAEVIYVYTDDTYVEDPDGTIDYSELMPENNLAQYWTGGRLNDSGVLVENASYYTTDYLEIPKWNYHVNYNPYKYVHARSTLSFTSGAFYDSSKTFISRFTTSPAEIPQNAAFVRASFPINANMPFVSVDSLPDESAYMPYRQVIDNDNIPIISSVVQNSDGAKTNLVLTAMQYRSNDNFGYGNTHTAYSASAEAVASDGVMNFNGESDGSVCYPGIKYQMDCSAFVRLTVQGIYPEYTRYYGNTKNIKPLWGYDFEQGTLFDTPEGRLTAHKLALYCAQHGYIFAPKPDLSNLEVGDMIFYGTGSPYDGADRVYLGISHTAIVTKTVERKDGSKQIAVTESYPSQPCIRTTYRTDLQNTAVFAARLPLPFVSDPQKVDCAITPGSGLTVCTITPNTPLKNTGVYTLILNLEYSTDTAYTIVNGFGTAFDFSNIIVYNGLHCITMVFPVDGTPANVITVTVSENCEVTLNKVELYAGFHTPTMI